MIGKLLLFSTCAGSSLVHGLEYQEKFKDGIDVIKARWPLDKQGADDELDASDGKNFHISPGSPSYVLVKDDYFKKYW